MNATYVRTIFEGDQALRRRWMFTRAWLVAGTALLMGTTVLAKGLTKADLLAMKRAGVQSELIIKMIRSDGIGFDLDARLLLELKKSGLSDSVIAALVDVKDGSDRAAIEEEVYVPAQELLRGGRFAEAAERLEQHLRKAPDDDKARSLLIVSRLKEGDEKAAREELERLRSLAAGRPSSGKYLARLDALFARMKELDDQSEALGAALESHDARKAREVVEGLVLPPVQKEVLHAYLDVYEGRFIEARHRVEWMAIRFAQDSPDPEMLSSLQKEIATAEETFRKYWNWMHALNNVGGNGWFRIFGNAELPPGMEDLRLLTEPKPEHVRWGEFYQLTLAKFLEAARGLSQTAPLSPLTMDVMFQASLFFQPYAEFERTADHLLKAKGALSLPVNESVGRGFLVIDKEHKLLRTTYHSSLQNKANGHKKAEPFEVGFQQVTKLKQKAKFKDFLYANMKIASDVVTFELQPGGVVPEVGMLDNLTRLYGELAGRQVIRNLGQYLVHVIGRPKLTAELLEVKVSGPGFFANLNKGLAAAAAISAGLEGDFAAGAMFASQLERAQEEEQAVRDQQVAARQQWDRLLSKKAFSFAQVDAFREIEELLRVAS
jgi:hypothetical protein